MEIPRFFGNGGFLRDQGPSENQHVIARSRKATHPRVASLAPSGQFTFWQSRGTRGTPKIDGIATPLAGLAMTRYFGKLKARSAKADRAYYFTVPSGTYTSMITGRIMGLRLVVL